MYKEDKWMIAGFILVVMLLVGALLLLDKADPLGPNDYHYNAVGTKGGVSVCTCRCLSGDEQASEQEEVKSLPTARPITFTCKCSDGWHTNTTKAGCCDGPRKRER